LSLITIVILTTPIRCTAQTLTQTNDNDAVKIRYYVRRKNALKCARWRRKSSSLKKQNEKRYFRGFFESATNGIVNTLLNGADGTTGTTARDRWWRDIIYIKLCSDHRVPRRRWRNRAREKETVRQWRKTSRPEAYRFLGKNGIKRGDSVVVPTRHTRHTQTVI